MGHGAGRGHPRALGWISALALAWLCGCSFLQLHSYYAPGAPVAEPREDVASRCEGNDGYVVSGPAPRIVVRSGEVALGIEAAAYRVTTVTAGPLMLPVLPALPPAFFPHRRLESGDILPIDFRILEPRDEVVDFSDVVVEVTFLSVPELAEADATAADTEAGARSSASSSFEVGEIDAERAAFEGWTPLWDLSDGWTLPLRMGAGDPRAFRISVRGLSFSGMPLDFPNVEFTPARGWLVCEQW